MKILNLILYSKNEEYDNMYKSIQKYLIFIKKKLNIDYYFYCFDNIDTDYKIDNDILFIKGKETYIPGILDKTIKSIEYFINKDYDYIIRSNISTPVNFELLFNFLEKHNFDFCGDTIKLKWINRKSGIINRKYFGNTFIFGTCIILSRNAYTYLIDNKDKIDYSIIDDVSIGIILNKQFDTIDIKNYFRVNNTTYPDTKYYSNDRNYNKYIPFYRNKSDDRNIDIKCIKNITENLIDNYNTYNFNDTNCIIIYNNNKNLQNCYNNIRLFYTEKIFIISNDNININGINYENIIYKYYDIGLVSCYYYFYINELYNKTLIINSTTNIDKYYKFDYKLDYLYDKKIKHNITNDVLSNLSLSTELRDYFKTYKISFVNDIQCIIDYGTLDIINNRYNLFNVIINHLSNIETNNILEQLIGLIFTKYN